MRPRRCRRPRACGRPTARRLRRLRRRHHAPVAAPRVVDELPASFFLELMCLLGAVEGPDRFRRVAERRVVLRHDDVGEHAGNWPAGDRGELRLDQRADLRLRLSHGDPQGRGGTSSAARSCRSSSFPTCGPFPWVTTIRASVANRAASAAAASCKLASCSAAVPLWPGRVSAFPPSATTVITRARERR